MKFGLREVVFCVLLIAIPVGAWFFVYKSATARNTAMLKQIDAKKAKLRELNQATAVIGDVKQEIDALDKGVAYLQAKLPSEKEIDKVLQEVWLLAETSQLNAKSIRTLKAANPDPAAEALPFAEQPIDMQLDGNFRGFYTFLQALENQPRIMRIHKMSLRRPDRAGPEGNMRASITMSIYFERSKDPK